MEIIKDVWNNLEKHYIPMVKTFITKVVGSRGIVVHEFDSEEFKKS